MQPAQNYAPDSSGFMPCRIFTIFPKTRFPSLRKEQKMDKARIFKTWALNQSAGFIIGWFIHGVFSHLFTGEHSDQSLTTAQMVMHNVSLLAMAGCCLYFHNKATMQLFGYSLYRHWVMYLLLPVGLFWLGYYAIGAPCDIVFAFIAISALNGYYISKALGKRSWLWWSILSSVVGIVVGTIIVTPIEPALLPHYTGLTKHIIIFTLEGSAIGVPMAIFGGLMLKRVACK